MIHHGIFSIDLVMILIIFLIFLPYVFFQIKIYLKIKSQLKLTDYYIICIILTYLVIGGYQQYFWTKNNKLRNPVIVPKTFIDDMVSKNDMWVYIYNFIYYAIFGLIIITIKNYKHFLITVLGAYMLLSGLTIIWYIFPNIVPKRMETNNYFFSKTKQIDKNLNNACPSAHVVFAVYSYYLLRNTIGDKLSLLIPILISYSCLKTSQHLFIDVVTAIIYTIIGYNLILKNIFPLYFK